MKKLNVLFVIAVTLIFVAATAKATETSREFSNFEITPVNDLYLGSKVKKVWTINYGTDASPITVVKHKTIEGVVYAVHSRFFEISYLCNNEGFGAKKLRKSWCNVPSKITDAVIDTAELERQRIISPEKINDEFAVGLIASYLPSLINDAYTHLLN